MTRPEDYWIAFGAEPIGLDVLRDGENARQAATYRAVAQAVIDYTNNDVLDIGANYGILEDWLRRAGYKGDYYGLDSNPNAVAKAVELGHEVYIGDIRRLPDGLDRFDVIVVKDVIEHLEDYQPLRGVFKVASEIVILALYLPFHDSPDLIRLTAEGCYLNIYNRQGVIALARECGFSLMDTILEYETSGTVNAIYIWGRDAKSR